MNQYIESVIAKLTGLQGEGGNVGGTGTSGGRHKYPVIKLMDYNEADYAGVLAWLFTIL